MASAARFSPASGAETRGHRGNLGVIGVRQPDVYIVQLLMTGNGWKRDLIDMTCVYCRCAVMVRDAP
jgi:hypothetical protein